MKVKEQIQNRENPLDPDVDSVRFDIVIKISTFILSSGLKVNLHHSNYYDEKCLFSNWK